MTDHEPSHRHQPLDDGLAERVPADGADTPDVASQQVADAAVAMMLHQTALMTWLVNTAGKAAAWLLGPPLIAAVAAGALGEPGVVAFGGLVGVIAFVMCLSSAAAPVPTRAVLDLASGDPGGTSDGEPAA